MGADTGCEPEAGFPHLSQCPTLHTTWTRTCALKTSPALVAIETGCEPELMGRRLPMQFGEQKCIRALQCGHCISATGRQWMWVSELSPMSVSEPAPSWFSEHPSSLEWCGSCYIPLESRVGLRAVLGTDKSCCTLVVIAVIVVVIVAVW